MTLQEKIAYGLNDSLYAHEVIDHLVSNDEWDRRKATYFVFKIALALSKSFDEARSIKENEYE